MELRDIRHALEDLNFAGLWEEHRAKIAIGLAAAAVLVLALNLTVCGGRSRSPSAVATEKYFFDLNTGKLVVGSSRLNGPTDLGGGEFDYPDGRAGSAVVAVVISCNDCEGVEPGMTQDDLEAVDASVGYVTRYRAGYNEAREKLLAGEKLSPAETEIIYEEPLYSNTEGKLWRPELSGPVGDLIQRSRSACGGQGGRQCRP